MPNIELTKKTDVSVFRKLALGTWQTAYDPSIYGSLRLRMDKVMRYIEDFRATKGKRITVTHMVAKAVAEALKRTPDANSIIRWNRIYLRKRVDLAILVVIANEEGGTGKVDLSSVKVEDADKISLFEMAERLEKHVEKVRARQDKVLEGTRQSMGRVPFFFINTMLKILGFLMYTLNLDLRWAGLPKDAFGSAMITNIGSLGLDLGYVPLVPYSHVPIMVCPGVVKDEPLVEDGKIIIGKIMDVSATFDHRIIDGAHAAALARTIREMFADPYKHFDPLPAPAGAPAQNVTKP
jgi:pyruvate/2-oxoglutarate dehydrogenase complex dihydrolipoamide acyltransferase (E2) component